MRGTIAELKTKHGFIDVDGKRVFFHQRALPDGLKIKDLTVGQRVEFDLKDGPVSSSYCDNVKVVVD